MIKNSVNIIARDAIHKRDASTLKINEIETEKPQFRGRVVFKDENGIELLEKDNLVLLRLRTYVLELLFNKVIGSEGFYRREQVSKDYISNLKRTICLFKAGSGGVLDDPQVPDVPNADDKDLGRAEPFRVVEDGKPYTNLSEAEKKIYYLARREGDKVKYYGKRFEMDPQWVFTNTESDQEVAMLIKMRIALDDFRTVKIEADGEENIVRNMVISELGLVIAEYDEVNNLMVNDEVATRITFDGESLKSLAKEINIEYYIYA